jgi:hypothetical protein
MCIIPSTLSVGFFLIIAFYLGGFCSRAIAEELPTFSVNKLRRGGLVDVSHTNLLFNSKERKLFFLFLAYDKFHNGHIWNIFFKDVEKDKYHIFMHAKNLPTFHASGFEHKITLVNQKYNEYFKLVYPANELFETALNTSQNYGDAFILISSDSIPVKPFNEIYEAFSKPFDSHQCISPTEQWHRFNENAYVPKTHFWSIMNKSDVQKIAAVSHKFPEYSDLFYPYNKQVSSIWEESYYPSAIHMGTAGTAVFDPAKSSEWGINFPSTKIQGSCPMYVWWDNYPADSPFVSEGIPRITERETKGAQTIVITPENLLRKLRKSSNFYFIRKMRGEIPTNYVELANGTHLTLYEGVKYVGLYDP